MFLLKLFLLTITALDMSALENKKTGLFILTYWTDREKCFACESLKNELTERKIEFTEINFFTDLSIAARFFTIIFPSIFYKQVGANGEISFYSVDYVDIMNGEFNEKYSLISKYFDPLSSLAKYTGIFVSYTFPQYLILKEYIEKIPFSIFALFGTLLLIMFIKQFLPSTEEKKKHE